MRRERAAAPRWFAPALRLLGTVFPHASPYPLRRLHVLFVVEERTKLNVAILPEYQVKRVEGNGYCNTVVVESNQGQEVHLNADGTFVEIALKPNSMMVADLVSLDERGFIEVDPYSCTSMPGIFAAGDVTNIFAEQVLVAVGEGVKAALSAYDYLLPTL